MICPDCNDGDSVCLNCGGTGHVCDRCGDPLPRGKHRHPGPCHAKATPRRNLFALFILSLAYLPEFRRAPSAPSTCTR